MSFINEDRKNYEKICRIREYLTSKLENYEGKPVRLEIDNLNDILFGYEFPNVKKSFAIDLEIAKKIDMSNVSFDGVDVTGFDFTGFTGVSIDPSTLQSRDFTDTKFTGVRFTQPLSHCVLYRTDFTGSEGAFLDPSLNSIYSGTKFSGVSFLGEIYSANLEGCDFTGSFNAVINLNGPFPETINSLIGTVLTDAIIKGAFDECFISNTNFSGAKSANGRGVLINPNELIKIGNCLNLAGCNFDGVEFTEEVFNSVNMAGANFKGSKGFVVSPSYIVEGGLNYTKLAGVTFDLSEVEGISLNELIGTDFAGSKNACLINNGRLTIIRDCDLTDAKFHERYSLDNILTSFEGLDTCTYRGKLFRSAYDGCKDEMKEELGKVYQKIDNAMANSKRNN